MDFRPVLFSLGVILCILSVAMALPMLLDLSLGNPDWKVFFFCILVCGFFGGSLVISTAHQNHSLSIRQAFMLLTLSWLGCAAFGGLPFFMSEIGLSLTDSLFESMSGITTTGMTVINNLDEAPEGILLWRALLQWLGGFGIVVMAMTVLPFLKMGGMQLFRTESGEHESAIPRLIELGQSIGLAYLVLTALCIGFFMLVGMTWFEGVTFGLATISTGGFAPYDSSFQVFNDPLKEALAIVFMIAGALPFILYIKLIRGKWKPFATDTQVRTFLTLISCSILALFFYLVIELEMPPLEAMRHAAFNLVSVMTGTGFSSANTQFWGPFAFSLFLFVMAIGGCAGSTTCGIRIFRLQVLYEVIAVQIKRLLHPSGVFVPYFNRRPVPPDVPLSVMSFFFVYALTFVMLSLALSFTGLQPVESITASLASISNAGPTTMPEGGYAALNNGAKWLMSLGMLLGRLEIFTVLVLLWPHYWRR